MFRRHYLCKSVSSFTLLETLIVIVILMSLMAAMSISLNSVLAHTNTYAHSKEVFKNYIEYHKYKSQIDHKKYTIYFDEEYKIYSDLFDCPISIEEITNDLKIIDSSTTNIVFDTDGSTEENMIAITDFNGNDTNILDINIIGIIKYRPYEVFILDEN